MKSNNHPAGLPVKGDLFELVQTEQRLEVMLTRARQEADAVVAAAREAAADEEKALSTELDRALARAVAEVEAERERQMEAIGQAADREVMRLEQVDEAQVQAVARELIGQLLSEGDPP